MDNLRDLERWAEPLLARLTPAARRRLARTIATELRRRQRERIASQRNPDGTPFEPRKPQARHQRGAIRRMPMFTKIRQARHLRTRADPNTAEAGFFGRVARIARAHQEGRRDRVRPGGPMHDYAQRELLGYSDADRRLIRDLLIQHLAGDL